jgi:O-acetyl-ADP-ribose deacetylase (regulator of RNase III)
MELILTGSDELADAWERLCGHYDCVRVHRGSILDLTCDAVVSPANSFGFMDGGLDALYRQRFGDSIQERVQDVIRARHGGELLVGLAEIVATGDAQLPYLIVAPTMRVPMILRETVNPYLAMRALLRLVLHGELSEPEGIPVGRRVQSVGIPGLGTGVGQVSPTMCAHQVAQAIDEVVLGRTSFPRTWAEASERHQLLYTDKPRRLQHDGG